MSTYWYLYLTAVIEKLGKFFEVIATVSLIMFIVLITIYVINLLLNETKYNNMLKKYSIVCSILTFVFGLLFSAMPTKKDLYIIYGVGSTIEYVKGNEKLQEIPNKAFDALGSWFDSITEENKKEK